MNRPFCFFYKFFFDNCSRIAVAVLMDIGRVPEVICTDPDGNSESDIEKEILACELGSIVLIHAHGDNIDKLKNTYPISNALLPLLRQGLLKSVQFQQIQYFTNS